VTHDGRDVRNADISEAIGTQNMREAAKNVSDIVKIVVLEIVRAINRIELAGRQRAKVTGITADVGIPGWVDIQQDMLPISIYCRNWDRLAASADV
jgi:hypothetical protein